MDSEAEVVLVGECRRCIRHVKGRAKTIGLGTKLPNHGNQPAVVVTGPLKDIQRILDWAAGDDIVLSSVSNREGFRNGRNSGQKRKVAA